MCRLESEEGASGAKSRIVQGPEWVINFKHKMFHFLVTKSVKSRIKGIHNSHYLG